MARLVSCSFTALFVTAFLMGCACIDRKIAAHGKLGPHVIDTTVDSDKAKYYLENYLAGKPKNQKLDTQFQQLDEKFGDRSPNSKDLEKISHAYSVDTAALFWGRQVLKKPENLKIQQVFARHLKDIGKSKTPTDLHAVLVPGFNYAENGHRTGADLKKPLQLLRKHGVATTFVKVDPQGTVEENSAVIAETIRGLAGKRLVLAGPSSAGPAIHHALGKRLSSEESLSVVAWLNLGGVLKGSPLVDWVESGVTYPFWRLALWAKGWRRAGFHSLRADLGRSRSERLVVPHHIKVVNYIGLSLSGNISKFAEDKYCLLRSTGPNDGLAFLPDMMAQNSLTIIAPRSDHFFAEDPEIDKKTVALVATLSELLSQSQVASTQ